MSGIFNSINKRWEGVFRLRYRSALFLFLALLFSFLPEARLSAQCTAVIGSNIDPLEGCDILTIQFYDLSTGTVTRSWDFGDGSATVVAQNPVHSFTTGDNDTTFTVKLTITCASGTSSATKQVTVFAKPRVEFQANKGSVCAITDSICMINSSFYSAGSSYLWNFGDGTISEEYEPCKIFSTPGTYDISLTVINDQGCLRSVTEEDIVSVEEIPSTAFSVSANNGCTPFSVVFNNITDTVGNDYSNWTWDFGDGSPLFYGFTPPPHTYMVPGIYTVNLGTVNSLGCSNYSTQKVTVKPAPVASISTSSPACINDNLLVEYTGEYYASPTFTWQFIDAASVNGSGEGPYNVRYATAGNKTINLTVTENGCSSTVSEKVQITPIAQVYLKISANYDTVCSGQEVTFTASPVDFVNYCFYINNNPVQCSSENKYVSSSFNNGDKIYVKISDINGCTEIISDTLELHVKQTPAVSLVSSALNDTVCFNENVLFTATPAGYDEYTFYLTNEEVQKSSSNLFNTSSLENGQRVYVTALNNNCSSDVSNNIITTVSDILPKPQVYCGACSSSAIEYRWDPIDEAVAYEVSVDNGPFGFPSSGPSGLSHLLTGLTSNETHTIRVRALDATICGEGEISDEVTCTAIECDEVAFKLIGQYMKVCSDDIVSLSIDSISIPNYAIEWNNQAGTNSNLYSFVATKDTIIPVTVTNLDAPLCPPVTRNFKIGVTQYRAVTLESSEGLPVCEGSDITFTALPETFLTYLFYDNNKLVQQGPDNTFSAPDPVDGHRIQVKAMEGGCISTSSLLEMDVTQPLEVPQVNYSTSTVSSITFTWQPIAGASGYLISVDNGPYVQPSSGATGLSHTVNSLSPGDGVVVTVMALGDGVCGDSEISQPAIGYAENCTAISYSLETMYRICSGESVTVKIENLNISNYSIKWGSMPASKTRTITLTPANDTIIPVLIRDLDSPLCPAMYNIVHIFVTQRPESILLTSSDSDNQICDQDNVVFTAEPGGYDFYEFYLGYNLVTGSYLNTYSTSTLYDGQMVWALPYRNGCAGDSSNQIATAVIPALKAPQVNCDASTSGSISFSWDDISDATGYLISLDGGNYMDPSSGSGGLLHEVTGLSNGTEITATVIATGVAPCGDSKPSLQKTCIAANCDAFSFDLNPYDTLCEGETVDLNITGITIPNYAISWGGGTYGTETVQQFTTEKDTLLTVDMQNLDQPSCPEYSRYFDLNVIPVAQVTLGSDDDDNTLCAGQEVVYFAAPAEFERYMFYNGTDLVQDSGISTYIPTVPANGDDIHVEAFMRGCSSVSNNIQTAVRASQMLNLMASSQGNICSNESVTLTATSGFSYYYFMDMDGIIGSSDQNITQMNINSPVVTVTAIDDYACLAVSPDTLYYSLLLLPKMILSCSVDTICLGDYSSYFAQPPDLSDYLFINNSGEILQQGPSNLYVTDALERGDNVSVVGVDGNGCSSQPFKSDFPYILPGPDSYITSESEGICLNDSVTLTANLDPNYPTATYYWSTGETTGSIKVSPKYLTNYSLFYNYGLCNNKIVDNIMIDVERDPPPLAYAGEDSLICVYDSLQLFGSGGLNFFWSDSSLSLNDPYVYNPYAKPLVTTTYILTVTNRYCTSVDTVTVFVDKCLEDLTDPVPQIITPNGDGINDYWELYNIDYFENSSVDIYNRWGNRVYTASPYLNDWDGRNNKGEELPDGTYYFVLDIGNGTAPRTGFIIIHR